MGTGSAAQAILGLLDELILFERAVDLQTVQFFYREGLENKRCMTEVSAVGEGILPAHQPEGLVHATNRPNPFAPGTDIEFGLEVHGRVDLSVLDVGGRVVRALVRREMGAGNHSVRWDGTDDMGERLPAGVYFWMLRTPQGSMARKMMMLQ